MAESDPSKPKTKNSTSTGFTRHIGNETTWYVFNTAPDYCRVGNSVVGFDTFAELSKKSSASPNVKAQLGGKPVYRVGDFVSGVQANAGQGVRSTTSLSSGYVKFLNGQANVKVNGIPVVMDGTRCIINCNKAGVGGTTAVLRTATKTATSKAPKERSVVDNVREESGRVIDEKWKRAKEAAGTVWEALPWTSSDATSAAARKKIGEGVMGSLEGLATLMGPPPDMAQAAYMSGDAASIALVEEMQARQQQALGAIVDQVKDSWVQAEARNGIAGASAMVLTTLGIEIVGGKGTGALGKVAMRVGEIVRLAKTPLEAASLLDKELVAARAAGKSADELRVLTKARDERLAQARKEAADPKGKEGVHVAKGRLESNAKDTLNGKNTVAAESALPAATNPSTRLPRSNGSWVGEPGDGAWHSTNPNVIEITGGTPIQFTNGRVDFTPWSKGQITFEEGVLNGTDADFRAVYDYVQQQKGLPSPTAAKNYLREIELTPHHLNNTTIQLIPTPLHGNIPHIGSASDLRGGY